jgi:hypothetical protein
MTDREIILFLTNLLSETSTFSTHNKFKFQHTIRKYNFEKVDGIITITEKFTPVKTFKVDDLLFTNRIEKKLVNPNYMEIEWFEEFKLVVKKDIKTEIHNLLFDKLT